MAYIDVGSSIVDAYAKGRELAQQRQALLQKQLQDQAENELKKEQLKQQNDQFQAKMDQADAFHKALIHQQDLENQQKDAAFTIQRIAAELGFQQAAKGGDIPPGFKGDESTMKSVSVAPGVATTEEKFNPPEGLNLSPVTGLNLDPQTKNAMEAEKQRMILGPAAENAQELERLKQDQKYQDDEIAYYRALEVARINGEYRLAASKNTKDAFMDRPIPPNVQRDTFGLDHFDPSLTYRTAQGQNLVKSLTPQQQDKLSSAQSLLEDALQVKQLLETYKYENYFQGGEGLKAGVAGKYTEAKTAFQGGMADATGASIRNKLGAIADRIKKENEGTAFTASEKPFLVAHAPTQFRDANPVQAKSTLEEFIKDQNKLISLIIQGQGAPPRPNINTQKQIITKKPLESFVN